MAYLVKFVRSADAGCLLCKRKNISRTFLVKSDLSPSARMCESSWLILTLRMHYQSILFFISVLQVLLSVQNKKIIGSSSDL